MRWIVIPVLAVLSLFAVFWLMQRSFIYYPTAELDPTAPDAAFEEVALETSGGIDLAAWLFPPPKPEATTVIVFNGNSGNRSHRVPLALALSERGHGVLLVDYRGYGGNPGSPTEEGLYADARAARDFLQAEGVDQSSLVYFGESLGAAVALDLAIEHPPAALILRSPFTSLADVAAVHYPFLPVSLLLRDEFANRSKVADLETPLLVVAGTSDEIVPVSQSAAVWDYAPEPKRLVMVDGATHNAFALLAGANMIDAVNEFIVSQIGDDDLSSKQPDA